MTDKSKSGSIRHINISDHDSEGSVAERAGINPVLLRKWQRTRPKLYRLLVIGCMAEDKMSKERNNDI